MELPTLTDLEAAAAIVYRDLQPTPAYAWPLLAERCGTEVWVKHENHTSIGAFKIRGGLVYMHEIKQREPKIQGVIAATRGNHGQSVAHAAGHYGVAATVVVPIGNSVEKNAAMRSLGADLVEIGHDFQAAHEHAEDMAEDRDLHFLHSFHPLLVLGVGTYSLEFLQAVPYLDTVYVPIGLGSGICGMIAARDGLGSSTEIVGVVAENAAAYALSFERGEAVSTASADTIADGVACRVPHPGALESILKGVERVVTVSEDEIRAAMRWYYTDTHNVAEGAGAAPLAALVKEQDAMRGRRVGLVLSGGNVDTDLYRQVLAG